MEIFDELYEGKQIREFLSATFAAEYEEFKEDYERIDKLIDDGHPEHCACRQIWGDGECECDMYKNGYDPYDWMNDD